MGARKAIDLGWKVAFCLDPVLYVPDWEEQYQGLIKAIFRRFQGEEIEGVSVGSWG